MPSLANPSTPFASASTRCPLLAAGLSDGDTVRKGQEVPRAARARRRVRDSESVGHRLGAHPRSSRFRGAGDDQRGIRVSIRPSRQHGRAMRHAGARGSIAAATRSAGQRRSRERYGRRSRIGGGDDRAGRGDRNRRRVSKTRRADAIVRSTITTHAVERIRAAAEAAQALPFPFTLTARAENYLVGRKASRRHDQAPAGVSGGRRGCALRSRADRPRRYRSVVRAVDRPVNVVIGLRRRALRCRRTCRDGREAHQRRQCALPRRIRRAGPCGTRNAGRGHVRIRRRRDSFRPARRYGIEVNRRDSIL